MSKVFRWLTSFLDLLPAELVPPDHREDGVEALLRDHLQRLLQVEGVEAGGGGLDVAHHADLWVNNNNKTLQSENGRAQGPPPGSRSGPGVPGLILTNSWMVSRDVDESLETPGLLRWTLAPQDFATFSISSWSVETQTLRKKKVSSSWRPDWNLFVIPTIQLPF